MARSRYRRLRRRAGYAGDGPKTRRSAPAPALPRASAWVRGPDHDAAGCPEAAGAARPEQRSGHVVVTHQPEAGRRGGIAGRLPGVAREAGSSTDTRVCQRGQYRSSGLTVRPLPSAAWAPATKPAKAQPARIRFETLHGDDLLAWDGCRVTDQPPPGCHATPHPSGGCRARRPIPRLRGCGAIFRTRRPAAAPRTTPRVPYLRLQPLSATAARDAGEVRKGLDTAESGGTEAWRVPPRPGRSRVPARASHRLPRWSGASATIACRASSPSTPPTSACAGSCVSAARWGSSGGDVGRVGEDEVEAFALPGRPPGACAEIDVQPEACAHFAAPPPAPPRCCPMRAPGRPVAQPCTARAIAPLPVPRSRQRGVDRVGTEGHR